VFDDWKWWAGLAVGVGALAAIWVALIWYAFAR
jgi:hypothetical protein